MWLWINARWLNVNRKALSLSLLSLFFLDGSQLQIWDTAGQERFRSITQSYYRSANALILTYDITCEDSFRCLPEWLKEIEQYANSQVVTILVGEENNSVASEPSDLPEARVSVLCQGEPDMDGLFTPQTKGPGFHCSQPNLR